ncbi:MAG: hypothetical protein F6K10_30540 [Moorea sp. SIO2B7]|nr:hypothetical protein [Moorena sp. SIO2B7]
MKNKFFAYLTTAAALTSVLAISGVTNVATITNSQSIVLQTENISEIPVSIQKFDWSLGRLTTIVLGLLAEAKLGAKNEKDINKF